MKKYFLTGLAILLPLALTIAVVIFIINFLTNPFVGFFEHYLEHFSWYEKYQAFIHFVLQLALLFTLFFFTVLLGFLTKIVLFKSLLGIYDYLLHRIPIIKTVYKTASQVIRTIFGDQSRSFKQVVMVPFPNANAWCIGLVSSPAPTICTTTTNQDLITVFVPTTPNPTSGFLMMYQRDQVTYLDMKIEDALKYIISCGVIHSSESNSLVD